jgi:hypothetical protein
MEDLKKQVEEVYQKWQNYKETAEQHEFVTIFMRDQLIEAGYKDLQNNWNDEHAKSFIRGVGKLV